LLLLGKIKKSPKQEKRRNVTIIGEAGVWEGPLTRQGAGGIIVMGPERKSFLNTLALISNSSQRREERRKKKGEIGRRCWQMKNVSRGKVIL